jgi:hypothetical protein
MRRNPCESDLLIRASVLHFPGSRLRQHIPRAHRDAANSRRALSGKDRLVRPALLQGDRGHRCNKRFAVCVRRPEEEAFIERREKEAASLGTDGVLLPSTESDYGGGVGAGVGTHVGTGGGGIAIGTSIFSTSDNETGRGLAIFVPAETRQ